jgi:hypothetical protein
MIQYLLGDAHGETVAARIDTTLGKLPGLGWFDRARRSRQASLERLSASAPSLSTIAASN